VKIVTEIKLGIIYSMLNTAEPTESANGTALEHSEAKKDYIFVHGAKEMILGGQLNIFLVCVPLGIISYFIGWPDVVSFILALLALAPLAERLGFITEQLTIHTNEAIGGLLNATFGNATELIVSISALSKGLNRLVQLSLLGSVLSNMLLVLGTAFLCGGIKNKTQYFSKASSQINCSLLLVGTMAVVFPTFLSKSEEETHGAELKLSRGASVILLLIYVIFLFFQVFTLVV
jgi:Ca2+:H+ antiporter